MEGDAEQPPTSADFCCDCADSSRTMKSNGSGAAHSVPDPERWLKEMKRHLLIALLPLLACCCIAATAEEKADTKCHGLVGLRPLPRTEKDWKSNHGGSWQGTPTYEAQKGIPLRRRAYRYGKGWLDGDFKTKRVFFEHYWGSAAKFDDLDPKKNQLVKKIKAGKKKAASSSTS